MRSIEAPDAPAAIGSYSQAVVANGFAFCSGQIALDPTTGQVVEGDVAAQTKQALLNLAAVLRAAGTSLDRVVRCTVYLRTMDDFAKVNAAYSEAFGATRPARAMVAVSGLPRDVRVEIDAIAVVDAEP